MATIKPSSSDVAQGGFRRLDAGAVSIAGMSTKELITTAFGLRDYQLVGPGGPIAAERYDIDAKSPSLQVNDSRKLTGAQWSAALDADDANLRSLLADRFGLRAHIEKRLLPAYALILQKPGMLKPTACGDSYYLQKGMAKGSMRLASLAALLSRDMGRPVQNATGLQDCYTLDLKWSDDPNETEQLSLGTVLKSIGIRLVSRKAMTEILVVDHVEEPSEN